MQINSSLLEHDSNCSLADDNDVQNHAVLDDCNYHGDISGSIRESFEELSKRKASAAVGLSKFNSEAEESKERKKSVWLYHK